MADRRRAWADVRFAGDSLAAGATGLKFDLLSDAPTMDTLTAVRILVDLTFNYVVSGTVVDALSIVDLGIGVCSVEAFVVGGSSLPSPAIQADYPPRGWLYCGSQPVSHQAESTGVLRQMARFAFDVRSARKIDKGVLFMRAVNTNVTVGGAMQIVGRTRVLCLT